MQRKAGLTSQSVVIRLRSTSTDLPVTNVEHDAAGIEAWYRREAGLKTTFALAALAATNSAWVSGGLEHISDGFYRLDVPNAAFAAGSVTYANIGLSATGVYSDECYVELVDATNDDIATALANLIHYQGGLGEGDHTASVLDMTGIVGLPPSGAWRGCSIAVIAGTGIGQTCVIKAYDGTSITIYGEWDVPPDETSEIIIYASTAIPADVLEREMKRLYAALVGNVTRDPDAGTEEFSDADDAFAFRSTVDQTTGSRTISFEE